ncbi:hypothetical protein D3C72_1711560 [compost metagenome]
MIGQVIAVIIRITHAVPAGAAFFGSNKVDRGSTVKGLQLQTVHIFLTGGADRFTKFATCGIVHITDRCSVFGDALG